MYPTLYSQMVNKLTNQITEAQGAGIMIPYKTRVSLSLFMGQPLDSSMTPQGIMSAQPQPNPQQGGPAAAPVNKNHRNTSSLGKTNSDYQTPLQAAEQHKGSRSH